MKPLLSASTVILTLGFAASALANPFADIQTFDPEDHSQAVTECDRQTAHSDDPHAVAPGVSGSAIDGPAAIAACEAAVAADPNNPRLNYQMARAYGSSGLHDKANPYRAKAIKAGYPQSLFVIGYMRIQGMGGADADPCYGGELVRLSADAGRFAGLVGFPHYVKIGTFEGCSDYPAINEDQIMSYLDEAETRASGYYQTILVRSLKHYFANPAGEYSE